MPTIVVPTVTQGIEWKDLREGLRNCITTALGGNSCKAVVYSSWPMKYNIGETIRLLQSDADDGKVHAWMITIHRADPNDTKIGGNNLEFDLSVRIWGFIGQDSTYTGETQSLIEQEVQKITRVVYYNSKHWGLTTPTALVTTGIITWNDIDTNGFGDGSDCYVAQGELDITVREHYT